MWKSLELLKCLLDIKSLTSAVRFTHFTWKEKRVSQFFLFIFVSYAGIAHMPTAWDLGIFWYGIAIYLHFSTQCEG